MNYTRESVRRLSDEELQAEWEKYLSYSYSRQRLRGLAQKILRRKSSPRRVRATEIPEGGLGTTKLGEQEILLAKVEGKIYAMDNACGHLGYPLNEGRLDGHRVTCIWHFASFDVRTGEVVTPGIEFGAIPRFEVETSPDGNIALGKEL